MQEIKLTQMRIRNFKGIRELDIAFNGKDINVLGDNGTGKTSVIDSFTWLLFGKDSLDRADFGIKPTDKAGNIIHQLETSVEAIFDISGTERAFKKTLSEVWTRKRGAAEAEFTRNENNFYIDGVPKKKTEYTAAIKEVIDEEVFKIITNPLYFNESVNWKDRRSVLLTICGEVSDEDVIYSNPELLALPPILKGKAVADFKEITAAQMRRINKELEMIPVKIQEAEWAKPNAEGLIVDTARKDELLKEIDNLREQKSGIVNGTELLQAKHKLKTLKQELADIYSCNKEMEDKTIPLTSNLQYAEFRLRNAEREVSSISGKIAEKRSIRFRYSSEWDEIFAERFTEKTCPTCGRKLSEGELEEKRVAFNKNKAARLDEIEKKNNFIGLDLDILEKELEAANQTTADIAAEIIGLKEEIQKAHEEHTALVAAAIERTNQEKFRIEGDISETEHLIRTYEENFEASVVEIDKKIGSLSRELSEINEVVAAKAQLERQDKRIAELREQQKALASEYTVEERNLYLAEQFIVAKVNMLNERINKKFKCAKFKLFDKQINGGLNEVCEVTYNGIPYKDLNNAMKINIGLDVINTISDHYGVTVPIMIDNAESVNEIYHTKAQQIRFYVSHDKKLVFEN